MKITTDKKLTTTNSNGYNVEGTLPEDLYQDLLDFIDSLTSLEEEKDKAIVENMPEDKAALFKGKYEYWKEGKKYSPGDKRRWFKEGEERLFLYIGHEETIAQPGWEPHVAHSLWRDLEGEIPGDDGYPTWTPSGQYQLGNIVRHNDTLWESMHEGVNVWEPGTVDDRIWRVYEQN